MLEGHAKFCECSRSTSSFPVPPRPQGGASLSDVKPLLDKFYGSEHCKELHAFLDKSASDESKDGTDAKKEGAYLVGVKGQDTSPSSASPSRSRQLYSRPHFNA